jgi:hypothetical protein
MRDFDAEAVGRSTRLPVSAWANPFHSYKYHLVHLLHEQSSMDHPFTQQSSLGITNEYD